MGFLRRCCFFVRLRFILRSCLLTCGFVPSTPDPEDKDNNENSESSENKPQEDSVNPPENSSPENNSQENSSEDSPLTLAVSPPAQSAISVACLVLEMLVSVAQSSVGTCDDLMNTPGLLDVLEEFSLVFLPGYRPVEANDPLYVSSCEGLLSLKAKIFRFFTVLSLSREEHARVLFQRPLVERSRLGFYFILFYFILFYFILFYFVLFYFVLFCFILLPSLTLSPFIFIIVFIRWLYLLSSSPIITNSLSSKIFLVPQSQFFAHLMANWRAAALYGFDSLFLSSFFSFLTQL